MSEPRHDPWTGPAAPEQAQRGDCALAPLPAEPHLRPGSKLLLRAAWFLWFIFMFVLILQDAIDVMQLFLIGVGGPALVVVASILRVLVLNERLNKLNNLGLVALSAEDFDLAAERFEALVHASRGSSLHRQVALHNLALAELCRSRWDRALSLLASVETLHKGSIMRAQVSQSSAALLAMLHAARGELGAARCWLKAGEKRKDVPTASGLAVLAEAMVHARAGNFDSAEQLLEHRWRAATSTLHGRFLGALRLVRAYALLETGQRGDAATDLILGARPHGEHSFDFLFSHWPEINEVLREESSRSGFGAAQDATTTRFLP